MDPTEVLQEEEIPIVQVTTSSGERKLKTQGKSKDI